ncbi:vWA domain-containing protein [Endothiovibrio diazotrophicus]
MFEFQWPWLFLALPLPWLARRLLPAARGGGDAALRVPFFSELAALPGASAGAAAAPPSRALFWLAVVVWALLLAAAARPQWLGDPVALPREGRDLMLAVDLSESMQTRDFVVKETPVDRLTAVKAVAARFIEGRKGDRLGLILFGDQAYLQTPLTFDRETVKSLLGEAVIGLAGKRTAIGDAIGLAIKRMRERPQGQNGESRVLVLLTDGANTAGEVSPRQAAGLAAEAGVRIYTIGVGADQMEVRSLFGRRRVNPSADLDEAALTEIADKTGGRYFRAKDLEQLWDVYKEIDQLEPVAGDEEFFRPVITLFHWPLGAALLLSLPLVWLRGRR